MARRAYTEQGGNCVLNANTLLYRQIHPKFVQKGRVTSQAFRPTSKDKKRLSVYNGNLITAEESWRHYTNKLNLRSVGVLAVTKAECEGQALSVESDPTRFLEHAEIDFRGLGRSAIERKADSLKTAACARGWQYRPNRST